ncbi:MULTISPECIES: GspH/FimT family pseudopilin [Pseudomonas]|jgi:type IV fimbrial biogenesis protein FimT|uniref:Type II secretion system protein H n=1 Tax=Pseudomonas migulae TaxID=78543 RepID=A0A1H5N0J2_9PSED|nr:MULTISPECIES: GspH/FimT family pseudopilin [Pseudomonas]TWC53457.1 type IV fimbrial biogenesis protein FimT [Pseudomonas sp. SJZ080]SEE95026.1 type IV fimbrial biogenesis protein FimT [Pseudomonas migulae]
MRQQGFSLIELLMGLMIVGIVLHLVSPAFAALTESNHREVAAESLISGIRNARTAALTHNQNVVIHGINGDWGQGWRIILDISGKGPEDRSNPLLIEHARDAGVPIIGNWSVNRFVRFSRLGEPLMPGKAFQAGTLHICAAREPVSHLQVVLARSGRVRLDSQKAEQALCTAKKIKAKNGRVTL